MTNYKQFVSDFANLVREAKSLPLGRGAPALRPETAPDAPKALFFAPHPDDECITGAIALRLLREARMNVIDVAVTLGSKKERQAGRLRELRDACNYLGFGLAQTGPNGLERINPKTRQEDPAHWSACVQSIVSILQTHRPHAVICPHAADWNSTHIGTHFLVTDALKEMPAEFECYLVESEFWGAMSDPNLMIEASIEDVADMIAATSFHVGEVERNPYHLSLPAWMMDNVRRGGEVVGGQGGAAPDFSFAALYRLRRWKGRDAHRFFEGGKLVSRATNIATLFP